MNDSNMAQWIRLAEMDMATARHMYGTYYPKPLEIICFHSQQAAEKMLKCYLISQGDDAPKNHDLQLICERCVKRDKSFDAVYEAAVLLTRYAVVPRYPAELNLMEADAEKAIEYAEAVMGFVKQILDIREDGLK